MTVAKVRCPTCQTLLVIPPRAGPGRMTCAICLSPVSADPGEVMLKPVAEPEVLEIADDVPSAEAEVRGGVHSSQTFNYIVLILVLVGLPAVGVPYSAADLLVLLTLFFVVMVALTARVDPSIRGADRIGDTRDRPTLLERISTGIVVIFGAAFLGTFIFGLFAVGYIVTLVIGIFSACSGTRV